MISIVSNVMAPPCSETPVPAAEAVQQVSDESGVCEAVSAFAKSLKAVEAETAADAQATGCGGGEKKDNGKSCDPYAQGAVYGIAGILEGFGSLSYQSDDTVEETIAQVLNAAPQAVSAMRAAQGFTPEQAAAAAPPAAKTTQAAKLPAETGANNGSDEQIAWMLQNTKAGGAPVQTQDEILKTIGEYLDSLENTSTATKAGTELPAEVDAVRSGMTTNTQDKAEPQKSWVAAYEEGASPEGPESRMAQAGARPYPETGVPEESKGAQAGSERAKAVKNAPLSVPGAKHSVESQTDEKVKPAAAGTKKEPEEKTNVPVKDVSTAQTEKPAQPGGHTALKTQGVRTDQSPPESVKENVLRIVDNVSAKASEGRYQFDVQLKPEFLGKVSIRLTLEKSGLKVHIKAGDDSVKAMLADQASPLQSLLKEKGVAVTGIEVTSDGSAPASYDGQAYRRNESGRDPGAVPYYEPAAPEEEQFGAAMERYGYYPAGGRLEFFA